MIVENGVLLKVTNEDIIDGKFEFPEEVTSIGRNAFDGCSGLMQIKLPKGITSIGIGAFLNCSRLTQIELPQGITSIGDSAFSNCSGLTQIELPEGITSIGDGAFSGCICLTQIELPDGVTSIGNYAFYACMGLTQIELPEGITNIGNNAFYGCRGLTQIELPKGVTSIGNDAFARCINLTKIEIPKAVTIIGNGAFSWCSSLKQVKYENRVLELQNNVQNIFTNKYALMVITNEGIDILLKNQEELIKLGFVDKNISPKQRDEQEKSLKGKLEAIYNNKNFKISVNYNQDYATELLNKIINLIGIDETENLLRIPNGINQSDIQNYGEKLLEVYEPKHKLNGNIPLVMLMLDNIDTVISKGSKDVRNDRNKFYTKFNQLLESTNKLNIEELLQSCAKEIGLNLNENQIQKIRKELQTLQLTEKSDEIKNGIEEKLGNEELNIIQRGVSSTLIFNVIKQNILNGGRKEDIEEIFAKELSKTTSNGIMYYGANIQRQKDKLKKAIEELYLENSELLNCNMVDILRDTKQKIGNRWLLKLKNSKNNIRDLQSMTEEEKFKLIANMEKNGIDIDLNFSKKYELKPNISLEEAIKVLSEEKFPEVLTYEKAEMIFSGMNEPISEKFGAWFVENKKEIMQNPNYYTKVKTLHNEFKYILQDSNVYATFENKSLTPKLAFDILNSLGKEGRLGNEELARVASSVNISNEEFKTAQYIFEITKKRERSYIPTIQHNTKKYRGRMLRADDPMNILAGNATNCCQAIGNVGEGSMMHAATEDVGRIFIVERINEKDEVIKPVAQSWVWRNKDRVCFDNIEIPEVEKPKLEQEEKDGGDEEAQKEILEIYKECAKNMVKQDERMLGKLLRTGRITQDMYKQLVVKSVTVGTGYNDLGVLTNSELEVVPKEDMILPREKDKYYKDYNIGRPWVDSGRDSVTGEGAQLYLVKGKQNTRKSTKEYDLEDLPVKPMYHNYREVRKLKARTIDKGVVSAISEIEGKVFRREQNLLSDCRNYKDLAQVYNIDENSIQVHISREKDWYVIFEENDEELYIADLAMVNGVNAEGKGLVKTDVVEQTLEIEESIYKLMLDANEEKKPIRFEATEDTSYINIMKMAKKGLVHVEEDEKNRWNYDSDINMHNMKITVDKEKLQAELEKVQEKLAKRREESLFRKVEDKEEGR